MSSKIAVLIPCYNESATIETVVRNFRSALPEADIYVYDNNSTDDTYEIAKAAGAITRREYLQGKGNVIRRMFREIDADCYLMVDGDDTYPAENARSMVELVIEKKADMVIGDRLSSTYFTENKRPFHNSGNVVVRKMINILFNSNIRDVMTGYRAFGQTFVKTFPILSKGFEIETEMTIHALDKNMHLETEIITYRDRPDGSESKLNTYSDGIKVIRTIIRLFKEFRPFRYYGFLSLVCLLASAALFLPVLIDYFRTGLVDRQPTLIISGFLALAAMQLFICGLITDLTMKKHRQLFEINLNMIEMLRKKSQEE